MAENRTVKVTLKAEIASYVASMMRGAKATDDLGAAAVRVGSDIERAMEQSEKAAKSSGASLERWGSIAKKTAAGAVLAFGALGGALLVQGVNANSFAEQNTAALTTMLGSADAAKKAMDEVYGLATETPFQFPVLTEQYKTFVAARTEMSQIIPLMHSYSAAVAALGGGNDKLQQVADAFAKIQSYGRADAGELNSLALAGIPVWQMLADAAGTSVSEIRDQVSKNMWDAQSTIAVLTTAMEEQFGGMLETMGDTFARWQDKLSGAQRRMAEQVAAPLMEVGKAIMESLTNMFNQATGLLKNVEWAPITAPLMAIPAAIDGITARMSQGGLQGIINGIGQGLTILAAAGELVMSVALPMVDMLGALVASGGPFRDMLIGILNGFNALPGPVQAGIAAMAMIRILNGPFTNLIESIRGTTIATRAAVVEHIRASQQMVVGAAAANASAGAHGRLTSTLIGTRAIFSSVGVAAKTAGTAIMGAFGGPVGLGLTIALAAVTVATTAWTDAQRGAEEAAVAQSKAIDAVTNSLDQNTGAFTANTVKVITDQLIDAGFVPMLEAAGVGMEDFTHALFGGADATAAFKAKLDQSLRDPALEKYLEENKMSIEDFAAYLESNPMGANALGIDAAAVSAVRVWQELENQLGINEAALARVGIQADAAAGAAGFVASPVVNTSQAESALKSLQDAATRALASFITLAPQKKKSGGGGGGSKKGEDPEIKRLKDAQKAIKKQADAEKKAAQDYEKLMRERSQAAQDAARAAEEAARDAADAEANALDKSKRAVDAYTSAQRQRQAIQRTLDAETDPVRRAQLAQALGDATAYEADMLNKKNEAERESEQAIKDNQAAKELAKTTTEQAVVAETDYKKASEESAAVQERAAAQIEAAAERLATATENAAERSSAAMGGASEDVTESLREWMDRLWEQIADQNRWADNMALLATKASSAVVGMFLEVGPAGASALQEMADGGWAAVPEFEMIAAAAATGVKDELLGGILQIHAVYPQLFNALGKKAADELVGAVTTGQLTVDEIMNSLKATHDGQQWSISLDADTHAALTSADSAVSYIQGLRPTLTISPVVQAATSIFEGAARWLTRARGGAIEGPGPKGKDSVPVLAAPGEHMLTTADVDAMGGQGGVYAFRRQLHRGTYPPDVSAAVAGAGMTRNAGTVINQTIYYPVAEPSSKAAIRAARQEVG